MIINRRKPINKFIMRNLNILRAETSTQYNDLRGAVSIDFHNGITQLHDLCKDLGVDLEKYYPVGLGFSEFTTSGVLQKEYVYGHILLLNKEKYNADNFDNYEQMLNGVDIVELEKFRFEMPIKEIGKYIKRFNISAISRLGNIMRNINVVEM